MKSGIQPSAASSSSQGQSSKIKGEYVVILQSNLPIQEYLGHLNYVGTICRGIQSDYPGKAAGIALLMPLPLGSPNPTQFSYVGYFTENIAQQIQRSARDIKVIQSQQSTLSADFENSPAMNWALSGISQTKEEFQKQAAAYDKLPKGQKYDSLVFSYRGLKNRGAGATIYVIDSGFSAELYYSKTQKKFKSENFSFFSVATAMEKTKAAHPDPLNMTVGDVVDAKKFWDDHTVTDTDSKIFHGTNVALYAAGLDQGMAPKAKVIIYNAGILNADGNCVLNSAFTYIALKKIVGSSASKEKSVLNCSFDDQPQDNLYASMKTWYEKFRDQGGHIAGSLGNAEPLSKPPIPAGPVASGTIIPASLPEAVGVGNLLRTLQKSPRSFWADPQSPPNVIWTFGTGLPGWINGSKYDDGGNPKFSGTSFSTPIVAGLIACILADANHKVEFKDLYKELLEYTLEDKTQGIRYLSWGDKKN